MAEEAGGGGGGERRRAAVARGGGGVRGGAVGRSGAPPSCAKEGATGRDDSGGGRRGKMRRATVARGERHDGVRRCAAVACEVTAPPSRAAICKEEEVAGWAVGEKRRARRMEGDKVIKADTIEEATEQILNELKEDPNTSRSINTRNNVIYFDGWDGLGASAVLRTVAQRLTPTSKEKSASAGGIVPAGLEFDKVVHIDCSKWESRRALQRVVAEQLELPADVTKVFDRQDEDDDFRGVAQDSRAEVEQVTRVMYQHMQKLNQRLLVIFHNGSSEEIDLASVCGLPLSGYSTSKVLWTFQGRFRLKPRVKVDSALKIIGTTDAFTSVDADKLDPHELWSYLVFKEAEEIVATHKIITGPRCIIYQPSQVVECLFYLLELCRIRHQSIDYDLATHSTNYWMCDGIIKQLELGEREPSMALMMTVMDCGELLMLCRVKCNWR
ncbi:hypothetical protein PR202_gb12501 [Eleusine coracana subsp. coracana]|uniref:Uncharacterized protein n=1 Tax=Eleusine coracana subsp. coracana TaxID=191504 RepID=A0AAV5EQM9_ELECO|nr:hypothetical protein PR202_gb12501 [Eleusine coracana subsp. coracana]